MIGREHTLRLLADELNSSPQDVLDADWGTNRVSAKFITDNLDETVNRYHKLFRRRKLSYEAGLVLYIYSHPSHSVSELMRSEPLLRECRGLVMSPLGVRSRPLPFIPTIEWDEACSLLDQHEATIKINGQMVTGLIIKGKAICVTKIGNLIEKSKSLNQMKKLVEDADLLGLTPIFELTDKKIPLVFIEDTGCYLVGLRSRRTGKMALSADLINIANRYDLSPVSIFNKKDLGSDLHIEGLVFNIDNKIIRSKPPYFYQLQKITSILRFGRNGDLKELTKTIGTKLLYDNLTTNECNELRRRTHE